MRLREHLMDILDDPQNGETWFAALRGMKSLSTPLAAFSHGGALTPQQSKAVLKFTHPNLRTTWKTHRLVRATKCRKLNCLGR